MGPGLTWKKNTNWKIVPKWSYTSTDISGVVYHVYFVYTLLKVVSRYD